jgi:uncharacterized membrane protein
MDHPQQLIERYLEWAAKIRDAYKNLASGEDYRYMFDPYWVRAEPYRVTAKPGETSEISLIVRNFQGRTQKHRIAFHAPDGIKVEPAVLEGQVGAESMAKSPVHVTVPADAKEGLRLIGLDMTIDGVRYGEWFDFVVFVDSGKKGG